MDGCSSGAAVRVRHQLLAGCKQVPTPPPFPSALGPSHAHTRLTPLQLYGELQRGLAVLATNGKQVQPHEVMDTPTTPGPAILVVDCPDLAYLAALQAAEQVRWAQRARGGGAPGGGLPKPGLHGGAAGGGAGAVGALTVWGRGGTGVRLRRRGLGAATPADW